LFFIFTKEIEPMEDATTTAAAPKKEKAIRAPKKTKRSAVEIATEKSRELRGTIVAAEFSRDDERTLLDAVAELREKLDKAAANKGERG
jgi:translation initiation factor 1 (eIF-1/SUI1)